MATAEEQDLADARPMTFRVAKFAVSQVYAPGMRIARCPCWKRNSFPIRIVGAIERERNWLSSDLDKSGAKFIRMEAKLGEARLALR